VFTDAGNNWASARQINPTRLFRYAVGTAWIGHGVWF
jgi:hypothetical protein